MEEGRRVISEQGRPHECELVWVKEEVLVEEDVNDLQPEIKGKLTTYLEKDHTSSHHYKEDEITEPLSQVWVKQEIKQEPRDPSQATDGQTLQSEDMPSSSDECKAENENVEDGVEGENEEETELQDVKSVCKTDQEHETSASDVQFPLETMKTKYSCKQNTLPGKISNVCKEPTDNQKCIYKCQICDKVFPRKYRLLSHINVHGDKNFQCDICLKLFLHLHTLTKHKRLVHCDERKFPCSTCGKQFKTNYELQLHHVSHSSERKYSCSVCGKMFTHQRRLSIHLTTHTAKKFKCAVCSRLFSRHTGLLEHERLHTGEKPFKCEICEKEFFRRSSMIHHERMHTGEKSHKCDVCGKMFYRHYHLLRHLRRHPQLGLNKSTDSG